MYGRFVGMSVCRSLGLLKYDTNVSMYPSVVDLSIYRSIHVHQMCPCADLSICGCIDLSIRRSIYLSTHRCIDLPIYGCVDLSICGCVDLPICGCIDLSIHSCVYTWICGYIDLSIHPCTDLSIHPCVDLSICECVDLSICGFIDLSICDRFYRSEDLFMDGSGRSIDLRIYLWMDLIYLWTFLVCRYVDGANLVVAALRLSRQHVKVAT